MVFLFFELKSAVKYQIRRAAIDDIPSIYSLLKFYSEQKLLLPKTIDELFHQIRGFRVVVAEDQQNIVENQILGCAHLDIFTENLAEVKSLAVAADFQGLGIGRILVNDCEKEAKSISIKKVFCFNLSSRVL